MKGNRQSVKSDILTGVICVVFLLVNLIAIGSGGRRRAKEAVCISNLRQWGTAFQLYAQDNDGSFPRGWSDMLPATPEVYWMEALRPYYGNEHKLRCCPTATKPGTDINPFMWAGGNGTFTAWGLFGMDEMENRGQPWSVWPYVVIGDYGSYGWNSFICNPPAGTNEWAQPELYNWRGPNVAGAENVPLLGDHQWIDCWPFDNDEPPAYDGQPWYSGSQMGRVCINRHTGYVCWVFLDGHARKVGLKELWKLKWHRIFDTDGGPGGNDWPAWMRDFKDY